MCFFLTTDPATALLTPTFLRRSEKWSSTSIVFSIMRWLRNHARLLKLIFLHMHSSPTPLSLILQLLILLALSSSVVTMDSFWTDLVYMNPRPNLIFHLQTFCRELSSILEHRWLLISARLQRRQHRFFRTNSHTSLLSRGIRSQWLVFFFFKQWTGSAHYSARLIEITPSLYSDALMFSQGIMSASLDFHDPVMLYCISSWTHFPLSISLSLHLHFRK